ncbi:MAG: Ig-like domain-containing protein [Bacteroidaceae bacterium]|nr:Ig-like domain-containing protein [Bacteroidaceae bacterium]
MKKLLTCMFAMLMVLGANAASDKLSVSSYSVTSGDALLFPVSLENETELSAFQCDVYLPEGIALALNEEGELDVALNPERFTSSHTLTAVAQPDGAVRIAAYSSSNKLIKGNAGELFYLNLATDAEVEGRMRISLRNIIFSTANASGVALDDISSIVTMAKYVPKNDLIVSDVSVTSGEALQIPVSLENETELSAFQCDVYLPEGLALALNEEGEYDVTLNTERVTSSHTLTAVAQPDGAVRIAAYSTQSKLFKGNAGELFYLNLITDAEVEGEKGIVLKNIIFSTAAAEEVRLKDATGTVVMTKYVPKNDFVLQDAEVKGGESLLFPVVLANESELAAFQCDVYLPEGLTLVLNEEGDLDVRLNPERATSSHTITARTQADGSIRVAAYANPTKPFKGNDDVLFSLNLLADKETIGEKTIEIKKIICSTVGASTVSVADVKAVVNVLEAEVLVSSVTLDKQNAEVVRGESVTLTATVAPEDADNKTLVWTSSDETVATVIDGVVKTLKAGEAVITVATTDGSNLSASCTVVAKPLLVSSVTLDKQSVEVVRGESVSLTATVAPEDADNKTLVWSSSDETVATVVDGVVKTLKAGEAVITATTTDGSNLSATCSVTVKPIVVSSVALDKQTAEVLRGGTVTLTATVSPTDADNTTLVWASSDETVATVKDGVVTALKAGEAVITATTTDGSNLSATCTVTVKPIVVSFIALDKQTAEVLRGETVELNVTFFPEDADNTAVVWTSSDETVATVTDGVVTALKSGRTVITVTTTDGTNLSSTCMVTVKPKYEILPAEVTLETGETVQLTISDGENVLPASKFIWVSQDSKVAQVDNTGLVTCIGEGITTITAIAMDGSGTSTVCTIIAKANGIDQVLADKAVQVVYYSATGEASDVPHKGLNIVKRTYEDGRMEVRKEICK